MSDERKRSYTWQDPQPHVRAGMEMRGLDYMQAMLRGDIPAPPISQTLGFALREIDEGRAVFVCEPQEYHYNPLGVVHGGLAATLLDSALGCAIHTTMAEGMGYTTVQLNVNYVRALTVTTGEVRCEAQVIHSGRQVATAEATISDGDGKIYAHATTTCLVFPIP